MTLTGSFPSRQALIAMNYAGDSNCSSLSARSLGWPSSGRIGDLQRLRRYFGSPCSMLEHLSATHATGPRLVLAEFQPTLRHFDVSWDQACELGTDPRVDIGRDGGRIRLAEQLLRPAQGNRMRVAPTAPQPYLSPLAIRNLRQ
jgi:hypothetical protein